MRILFMDWLHWTFPKGNHQLKLYLESLGVECKNVQPCLIGHCNRALLGDIPKMKAKSHHRGFNIDEMIKTEATMDSGWYDLKLKELIKYRRWGRFLIDWAYETFEKEQPDYIVVEGGLTYLSRPVLEVARELGIKIITIENSFIKGKIFIEFNTGYVVNRHTFARTSQDWLDCRVLDKARAKEANKIIHNIFKNIAYKTSGEFDNSQLQHEKTIFVPLQVYADQVTVYDSQFNNETFIKKILDLAENEFSDWNFILKCHPKEERNKPKATGDWLTSFLLPSNVTVIRGEVNSFKTQSLIESSDMVMVNNSQAGLEACMLEKPVVVFGDAFYSKKGFTIDYHKNFDWKYLKENYADMINISKMKLWVLYFYKWLYNKHFTDIDKKRISNQLNLKKENENAR